MKRSLALMLGLMLPVCLMTLPSQAKDKVKIPIQSTAPERNVADCQDALADLATLVGELDVTKVKDTQKIHKSLLKFLNNADQGLDSVKTKDLLKASLEIDDFWNELVKLADKGKIDGFQADDLIFAAWDAEASIVELFYPDWNCMDCGDLFPFPDYPWL